MEQKTRIRKVVAKKIPYYCYTAQTENRPIDGTRSTYLLDVLFACSTAVTHVKKMTAKYKKIYLQEWY